MRSIQIIFASLSLTVLTACEQQSAENDVASTAAPTKHETTDASPSTDSHQADDHQQHSEHHDQSQQGHHGQRAQSHNSPGHGHSEKKTTKDQHHNRGQHGKAHGHNRKLGHTRQNAHDQSPRQATRKPDQPTAETPRDKHAAADANQDPLSIFRQRILPIMQAKNPSSCSECHLSGVDLKDYIGDDQASTFAALRERGLIDVKNPDQSKLLKFISRKPKKPSLITQKVRDQELSAFRAWIRAAVQDPKLLASAANDDPLGATLPLEVIRHARQDRVLASFIDNIWSEVGRCAACHSPDRNQKQVKKHGAQVSWIKLQDPLATMNYMIEASLIDAEFPEDSLILTKPTLQVEHGGGQKMVIGDRSYKQFRRFIDDYAAMVNNKYTKAGQLPQPSTEVSHVSEIWLKLTDVPARFDKQLLQVDLYHWQDGGWSKARWATSDRPVFGKGKLWQHSLSLTAPRGSKRAEELRRVQRLPAGKYLLKIYVDQTGKLKKDFQAELGKDEFIGQIEIDSRWSIGFGRMTKVRCPQP